jgi:DNA-binding MarR family transcriptional regulator
MSARSPSKLPVQPPTTVAEALQTRFSGLELQAFQTLFAVRMTAQQLDNAVTEWMADTAASPARFIILMRLWASKGRGVPHKEIVAALGVTRATVSGLMAALERDGLVQSAVDQEDRRNLLASLTSRGNAVVEKAIEMNRVRLRAAFGALSSDELTTLTTLLQRVREGFAVSADATEGNDKDRDETGRRPLQAKTAHGVA